MTLVGLLWLALVQAFSPSALPRLESAAVPARYAQSAHAPTARAPRAEPVVSRRSTDATEQELRAARAIAATTLQRAPRPAPLREGASLAPLRPSRVVLGGVELQSARRPLRGAGHAVASRGSLLAYFPTAPPFPG